MAFRIVADNIEGKRFSHTVESETLLWLFADKVAECATDGLAWVWPADKHYGTDQLIGTVHKGFVLQITHALDSARYLGPFWGRAYPHQRSDWNAYDKLDPANYNEDRGAFFRECRARFGRCTGKTADGWIFGKTDRTYDPIYVETIVRVRGVNRPGLLD